jgi:hypothetical protein
MKRRDFIISSGTILTGTALLGMTPYRQSSRSTTAENDVLLERRPDPDQYQQPIVKALALGVNAPSPHNIQCWKFSIIDDHQADIYLDETKLLPHVDPTNRQVHIGLGCFGEMAKIGISRYGYQTAITCHSSAYDPVSDAGQKAVYRISLKPAEGGPDPLEPYIFKRQTSRLKYSGDLIDASEFNRYLPEAGKLNTYIGFDNAHLKELAQIFSDSFYIEAKKFDANEEVRQFFRFNDRDIEKYRNGISLPQMGYSGIIKFFAEKSLKDGDRDTWHSEKAIQQSLKGINSGLESARGYVYFNTATNTLMDWLDAGADYVRLGLALSKHDIYTHPYNQPTQEYEELKGQQEKLHALLGVSPPTKTQLIMRIGKSRKPYFSFREELTYS